MPELEDTLRESPIDFDSAVAYALHPEMRRLIIIYIVGTLLLPIGLSMFLGPPLSGELARVFVERAFYGELAVSIIRRVIGLIIALIGAVLLIGGLVGAAFKLVTDANIIAQREAGE